MDFKAPYARHEYLSFFKNQLLPEDFEVHEEKIASSFQPQFIQSVIKIGEAPSLELNAYEVQHLSENDPRVSLSRETFRLLAGYGVKRALVVFTSAKSPNFRLSLVTIDLKWDEGKKVQREYSNPRRYSFFLGPESKIHTPDEYLAKKGRVKDFEDLKSRFSIEVVNKEFYTQIAVLFTQLAGGKRQIGRQAIDAGPGYLKLPSTSDDTLRKEFTVRLIGRLVFCWFLKKKFSEKGIPLLPEELLSSEAVRGSKGYYHSVLEFLFFEVLNTRMNERQKKYQSSPWNQIPFLNGGLFTPHDHDFYEPGALGISKHVNTLKISDEWLKELFTVFETYNFTIDENTSVDVELSIEPEMLGRIFENLLAEINPETGETARKATGSYYTPRPIVEYMVDESLKQYFLATAKIDEGKIGKLLAYEESEIKLTDLEKQSLLDALDNIKVIDPACGSGAFPMGVLQKMLLILQKIDPDSSEWLDRKLSKIENKLIQKELGKKLKTENVNYVHKLGIIQNSIYGVDIQPIAVEISKLRFFLSLIVDEKVNDSKENRGIEPLPNLEFKFVCANSLVGLPKPKPKDRDQKTMFEAEDEIDILRDLRDEYLRSYGQEKKRIEKQFQEVQSRMFKHSIGWGGADSQTLKLSQWNPFSDEPCSWFDPDWMFGIKSGFDIVIANPPYITLALGKKQKHFTRNDILLFTSIYRDVMEYKGNTFILFIKRAHEIVGDKKVCTFIIPNTLLLNDTCEKVRKFLLTNSEISALINIRDKVFESAEIGGNLICIFRKSMCKESVLKIHQISDINEFNSLKISQSIQQSIFLKNDGFRFYIDITSANLVRKMSEGSVLLDDLADFYNGIKTGDNKKFLADKKLNGKYHPIIRGRDVFKYKISFGNIFVLFDKELLWSNTDETKLRKKPKIIIRQTGDSLIAALDNVGYLSMDTTHLIFDAKVEILFLLGLLNSKLLNWIHQKLTNEENRAFAEVKIVNLKRLPIQIGTENQRKLVGACVNKILSIATSDGPKFDALQNELDQIVYKIYGITSAEIKIIESPSE